MSDSQSRALTGPVTVLERPLTFRERYEAKFGMPDQEYMKRIMRASSLGVLWDSTDEELIRAEETRLAEPFQIFTLKEYDLLDNHKMGAPMPPQVRQHVAEVQKVFPEVKVRIHALRIEDPVVEYQLDGESVFGKAWLREGHRVLVIYPTAFQEFVRKWRFW